jgi:hypothetical protein
MEREPVVFIVDDDGSFHGTVFSVPRLPYNHRL